MNETRIMIVEDERIVAKDLQFRLQGLGYQVAAMASEGNDAIAKASTSRPNLVLMDIRLENGMDGIEAAEQIRNQLDIPVVFLTAYADQATLARAKITEPFGYILKPFEERELQSTIEIALYRHKAEQKLRDSERRYRSLVDNSQGLIWTHDLEGKILSINPAAAHLLGYDPKELVGRDLREFMPADFHAALDQYLGRLGDQDSDDGIVQVVSRTGENRLLQYRNVRYDEPGKPPYILAHAADVTDRLRVEQVLRDQNAYLTALHETTLGLMSRLDLEDLLEQIIARAAALVGTEHGYVFLLSPTRNAEGEQEMIMRVGIGAYNGFKGTKANRGVGLAGTVWQTGDTLVVDDYRNWSGRLALSSRDILRAVAGVPLKSGPQTVGVIGLAYLEEGRNFGKSEMQALTRFAELAAIALDNARLYEAVQTELGERKRAEAQVRSAESFLNTVIDNLPYMVFVKDAQDLRFVRFNRSGEKLLGTTTAALLGKNDYDMFPTEEAAFFERKDRETLALGKLVDIPEEPIDTPHGRRYLHTKKIPVIDPDGQPKYLLGISEDITERKLEQEHQRALERKLQETQKLESLGVLAGGIAHDFNNLLVAMLGNAGLALMEVAPDSRARQYVEQIQIAAQRAADLTRQMLAYSGKGRFIVQPLNVNDVIEEMVKLLRVSISKQAALQLNLAPNLPLIPADGTQLRQVVMNLITNASDALQDRPGTITVSTGAMFISRSELAHAQTLDDLPDDEYVFLEVADTGSGMDAETQARIFEPFFTTKFTGRGLGLAAVLGIMRGHHGAIQVNSVVGEGTVFRLLFPPLPPAYSHPEALQRDAPVAPRARILIVDDEAIVRQISMEMLERFGFETFGAENGERALEMARHNQYDLVLLDLTMPGLASEVTLARLRELAPSLRVMLMSGYSEQETHSRFEDIPFDGFIQKPFSPHELSERIRHALHSKSAAPQS